MSKIKDILSINLDDDIKSVIDLNSQSEADIKEELEGFILTESLAKHLMDFCDLYRSDTKQSGLWLSGFYGSGKSYFAKMIGLLLSNRNIMGTPMRERFMPKTKGLTTADLLENSISALGRTRNHVVLFDSAKENDKLGINGMMMTAFLRSLGFMDNWIGFWEYDLFINGQYDKFLQLVEQQNGSPWHEVRRSMQKVTPAFKRAVKALGIDDENYQDTRKLIENHIASFDANKLMADISRYLDKFSDTRLVFLVDEVSEAITQKKINLLDLEGMSETLANTGRRVWTVAIAQQRLDDVINSANLSKDKLTKLTDRFKNRIDIKADEVDTIIRQRLLAKTSEGSDQLQAYFAKNSGMIGDITNIGAAGLQKTTSAQTYADYYPFFAHQFKMLQYFLFGTRTTVKTQVGTRGMLISAFDILKKEAVKEEEVFTHVNAAQLCRQAQNTVSESLNNRYLQAADLIKQPDYKYINGRDLLQTIHFLTKAEVILTTAENISKSYVCSPDDYYHVKSEIAKALETLCANNILIYTANQYRITSEIEQRIIGDLNNIDVPGYRIKGEVTKLIKTLAIKKAADHCTIDGMPIDFTLKMNTDEPISNSQSSPLQIVFHDIFAPQQDRKAYIDREKEETQGKKNTISLVPDVAHVNEISKTIEDLVRMAELESRTYSTKEEKDVVNSILSVRDEKTNRLNQLLAEAYNGSTLIYCYNTQQMTDDSYKQIIDSAQRQMYGNIYTQRLSSTLSDSLAPKVLATTVDSQLCRLFTADEFRFFDTAGHFIGDQLSVVATLMARMKSFAMGADLEKTLAEPPTGYTYGTIVTTLAALFRADKIIVKHGGNEYHSYREQEAKVVFANSTQFRKASFKAVAKSLSYSQKQDIVDSLKDCNYKKWTGKDISYQMNDFELVDAIRTLSLTISQKIYDKIIGDPDMERTFHRSIVARTVLVDYTKTVTDANCYATAIQFLDDSHNDEFVKATEIAAKDLGFIANGLVRINAQRSFIDDVEDELDKSSCAKDQFLPLKESFAQMYSTNIVANAAQMEQTAQKVKDLYFSLTNHQAQLSNEGYQEQYAHAERIVKTIEQYPKEWNAKLRSRLEAMMDDCSRRQIATPVTLNGFTVKCAKSGLQLRDITYAQSQIAQMANQLTAMETEIVTSDPGGGNRPTVRNMKDNMPSGKLSVSEYRQWLTQQLSLLKQFGADDTLEFS